MPRGEPGVKVSARIPAELAEWTLEEAKRQGRSFSAVLTDALAAHHEATPERRVAEVAIATLEEALRSLRT